MATLTRGERFKDARTVHNIHHKQTMDEVAAATGISKSLIQSLENDDINRSVGYDKVAKLAAHYHVTTDYLLGLSNNPYPVPNVIDDLNLSSKSVDVITNLEMWDTPNEQNQYRTGAGRAIGIFNCLLESPHFSEVMGSLMMCFDCLWVNARGRDFVYEDYEAEEEIREAGHIVLHGEEAAKFYANEAGDFLKNLAIKEIPILVEALIQDK